MTLYSLLKKEDNQPWYTVIKVSEWVSHLVLWVLVALLLAGVLPSDDHTDGQRSLSSVESVEVTMPYEFMLNVTVHFSRTGDVVTMTLPQIPSKYATCSADLQSADSTRALNTYAASDYSTYGKGDCSAINANHTRRTELGALNTSTARFGDWSPYYRPDRAFDGAIVVFTSEALLSFPALLPFYMATNGKLSTSTTNGDFLDYIPATSITYRGMPWADADVIVARGGG